MLRFASLPVIVTGIEKAKEIFVLGYTDLMNREHIAVSKMKTATRLRHA